MICILQEVCADLESVHSSPTYIYDISSSTGPKDIVIIGRAAGRLTGKAVGYVQSARGQIDPLLQRSEINKVRNSCHKFEVLEIMLGLQVFLWSLPALKCRSCTYYLFQVHKELRETMAQLDAIRHEMRTGISIMNPGPMTRQVMEKAVPGLSTAVQSHVNGEQLWTCFQPFV